MTYLIARTQHKAKFHVEIFGVLILLVVTYYLFTRKDRTDSSATDSRGQSPLAQSFLPPIPKGYQIFASPDVAGLSHHKAEALSFAESRNQELALEREPDNPHDSNAIRLIGVSGSKRYFIGYLPRELSEQIVSTELFDSVRARLARIYIGQNNFLDIQYQIIGPKREMAKFDAFLSNQPACPSEKDYFKFFGLPIPKELTTGQAQKTIAAHKVNSTSEQQAEWDGYVTLLDEFNDVDFRDLYDLRKVSKGSLLDAISRLKQEGKSYRYLADNIEEVVDKLIELKPELERQSSQ